MDSVCDSKEFTGRKDPYTGKPLTVRLYVLPRGAARFRIEGGYDVAQPYPTMEAAAAAWTMKDGVAGLRDPADGYVCAYTGARLTPARSDAGFYFRGGFSPELFHTREEVLSAFAHLDGRPAPGPAVRVEAPVEAAPAPTYHEHELSEDTLERAESLIGSSKRLLGTDPVSPVSMSVPRKGKAKRR